MTVGVNRATLLTGAAEATIQQFDRAAIDDFGRRAFERLSVQGQSRLAAHLTGPGSVQEILEQGIAESVNPVQLARDLSRRWNDYERWEYTRLARTEVAFAQNRGAREELQAEGYQYPDWLEDYMPPIHVNCCCGLTTTDTGLVVLSVSPSACEICQAALVNQNAHLIDLTPRGEPGPEVAVPEDVPAGPEAVPEFATAREAEEWANQRWPSTKWSLQTAEAKMDASLSRQLLQRHAELEASYPESAARLKSVSVIHETNPRVSYATTYEKQRVTLPDYWWDNPERFRAALKEDIATGWHAVGCDTPDYVFTHEFGHLVYENIDQDAWARAWVARGPRRISGYADYSPEEGFAEAFATLIHAPEQHIFVRGSIDDVREALKGAK